MHFLKPAEQEEIDSRKVDLPSHLLKKKIAIFDLDETLIRCETKNIEKADRIITIKLPSGQKARIGLNIRPKIIQALTSIMKNYNMIVFTASVQTYADSVINYIDPTKEFFKYRLYRTHCLPRVLEGKTTYIKDLRVINNVPLERMVIIDNSVMSFAFQLDNGIPILPFYNNKDDNEMIILSHYLAKLSKFDDLSLHNGANFNLKVLLEEASSHRTESDDLEESSERSYNDTFISNKTVMRKMSKIQTKILDTMESVKKEYK